MPKPTETVVIATLYGVDPCPHCGHQEIIPEAQLVYRMQHGVVVTCPACKEDKGFDDENEKLAADNATLRRKLAETTRRCDGLEARLESEFAKEGASDGR